MNVIDNLYQFGETFEDKLQKVLTTNQNSKYLFIDLDAQSKSVGVVNNGNKPTGELSPMHNQQPGRDQGCPPIKQLIAQKDFRVSQQQGD